MTGQIFTPYPVTGNDIRAYADDVEVRGAPIEEVDHQVGGQHTVAVDAVEGAIVDQMSTANVPVTERTRDVRQKVAFGAGALRWWALAVDKYNETSDHPWGPRSVAKLNEAYDAASIDARHGNHDLDEVRASLTREYHELEANLDTDAEAVEGMLERGPADQAVLRGMFMAGFLPDGAGTLFDVAFTEAEWRGHLIQRLNAGELPDIMAIPAGYLATLLNDSDIMAAVAGLDVDGALGEDDARLVLGGSETNGRELYDTHQRLAWLSAYAAYVRTHQGSGIGLSDDWLDYLQGFYETATEDGLEALNSAINQLDTPRLNIGVEQAPVPFLVTEDSPFDFRSVFANGLMALSDELIGGGYDLVPDAVREAAEGRPYGEETSMGAAEQELFQLARLLDDSTIAGGTRFCEELCVSTMQVSPLLEFIDESEEDDFNDLGYDIGADQENARRAMVSSLLNVASRNHQAMSNLITGVNTGHLEGVNWDDGTGDYDPTEFMDKLYTSEWCDSGANAAKCIEWIATERAFDGPDRVLAEDTFWHWADITTSTGENGIFDHLLHSVEGDNQSYGNLNPALASTHSTVVAAYTEWLDDEVPVPAITNNSGDDDDVHSLDGTEIEHLMRLGVTTQDSSNILYAGITTQMQRNFYEYGPDRMEVAAEENGRLLGYYDAALSNEAITRTDDIDDARRAAAIQKADNWRAVQTMLAGIPLVETDPYPSAADWLPGHWPLLEQPLNALSVLRAGGVIAVIDDDLNPVYQLESTPLAPPNAGVTPGGDEYDLAAPVGVRKYEQTYLLLRAMTDSGVVDPATLPPNLLDDSGGLREADQIAMQVPGQVPPDESAPPMVEVRDQMADALNSAFGANQIELSAHDFYQDYWDTYEDTTDRYVMGRNEIDEFNERGELPTHAG